MASPLTESPCNNVLGRDAQSIEQDFHRYFRYTLGRDDYHVSWQYHYQALALAVRDRLMDCWSRSRREYSARGRRKVCYLSLEFLLGRGLRNALLNLDMEQSCDQALARHDLSLAELEDHEPDAGLGNGGLGRLAACFLDSCATLGLPVVGYGIRYQYGMFRQRIVDGEQQEEPDHWLRDGHPWELERPERTQRISFGGRTEQFKDERGHLRVRWVDTHDVLAVPYDVPIPGYRNDRVNTLRLWSSAATDEFDLDEFNSGSYPESVAAKNDAEKITMVLYPNDASECGKELRLQQQYFLASASLKDCLLDWCAHHGDDFTHFADQHCFQLNDTHPSLAVAELMRLLVDEHHLGWEQAWDITQRTMAYTNHTLLPEALERWPVRLFERLLPRLLEVIYEINARFLDQVRYHWPGDNERLAAMSIIEEGPERMVRMAHLAVVGSFSVNGVARLHSTLLERGLFRHFHELWPERFNNKTNGVTQRRWLAACNPGLRTLLDQTIGAGWQTDLDALEALQAHADSPELQLRWQEVKLDNKRRLAELVERECGVRFDARAMFDVQVKRIHEYKRQLLNALHVVHLYCRIKRGDTADWTPRCVLIGGKAAPGYLMAKRIIRFINDVAHVVNADPDTQGLLQVAFLPNYRVSSMEVITPAADLSQQISTAGKEASGTGNMKLMMNGAVTIGTLDGANIEIREAVGEENFFLFGLDAEDVERARLDYQPRQIIAADKDLHEVVRLIRSHHFCAWQPGRHDSLIDAILSPNDPWMVAGDFADYVRAQREAATAYADRPRWIRMSMLNTASSGRFSTDRTMRDYNRDIWRLTPSPGPCMPASV
ncbi:MAG: glycogen/starch/alpha-glucan phosphorylase [Gammaproteobacteria bacterium]|nr:glycogen/starch/alpha-glucan phosphorylase [Gammaproteobacteria bacterium]